MLVPAKDNDDQAKFNGATDTGVLCAYTEGYLAGKGSTSAIECPWRKHTPMYDLWLVGFEHARCYDSTGKHLTHRVG